MKFNSQWCLLLTAMLPLQLAFAQGNMRYDCGSEEILEEGACLLNLFDSEVLVTASGSGSLNTVTLRLADSDTSVSSEIDGLAYRTEIADVNSDGSPEVYVYIASAGSGSYGSLLAYVVEQGAGLSPISLPDMGDDEEASDGYMGHDEFAVVETSLIRRFPIYLPGDVNAEPSGGTRNVVYKLERSGDQWLLRRERITDY
jgi:hypothetical protein